MGLLIALQTAGKCIVVASEFFHEYVIKGSMVDDLFEGFELKTRLIDVCVC